MNQPVVAFDATPLHGEKSGIGIYTESLVQALRATGQCRDILLLSNRELPQAAHPEAFGAKKRSVRGGTFPICAVWMQTILPRMLAKLEPSLCHFPNYLAPLRAPCPRVVTLHDMSLFRYPQFFSWRKRYLSRSLLPRVAHRAEAIITVSRYSRQEILDVLGVPKQRVHVIHEAAPSDCRPVQDAAVLARLRRRYDLPDRFILSIGTIEPRKNLGRLLAAFDELARAGGKLRDVRLVLAGGPGWRNTDLRARIEAMQSSGRVRHLGYLPRADLPALYSLAEVVAYPSLYEGFGLPVLESMACGTPVLTSDRTSMPEIAGNAAFLVDPEDVQAIRKGLESILLHSDLAVELAERGRARAAQFSWQRAAEDTMGVYREVLRNGAHRIPPSDATQLVRASEPESALDDLAGAKLDRALLRTVHYADLFDSPIGVDELHRFLIGQRATRFEVEQRLATSAWVRARVARRGDEVTLRGREALIVRREEQCAATRALIWRHRHLLRLLSALPFLRLLAFSGGTSHENSGGEKPDLDLFLLTAPGRTWMVYALVIVLARLFGSRRAICANYLVDVEHLELPNRGDFFTAHELLFLKPIVGASWAARLLDANRWVYDVFPNAAPLSTEHLRPTRLRWQRSVEILSAPWAPFAESVARRFLRARIARQAALSPEQDVLMEPGVLKLHLQDQRGPALARFADALRAAGVWDPDIAATVSRVDGAAPGMVTPDPNQRASAWDALAEGYDRAESGNRIQLALRRRFQTELANWLTPGGRILDLGCGTGLDAIPLVEQGHDVTAIDQSPRMIEILREKEARLGSDEPLRGRLETHVLGLDGLCGLGPSRVFDVAYSNFGAVNCAMRPKALARTIGGLVRPGGYLVLVVMHRVCAWETLYHLFRFRPRAAVRRWRRHPNARVAGQEVRVWYPTVARLTALFAPEFEPRLVRAHGSFLPPPYLARWADRWPRVYAALERWEDRFCRRSFAVALADHFLIVLRRRDEGAARHTKSVPTFDEAIR